MTEPAPEGGPAGGGPGVRVRRVAPAEREAWLRATGLAFSEVPTAELLERDRRLLEWDRCLGAVVGDEIVGTAAAFTYAMTVPGGTAPVAGVTAVGVLPTHRRRGVLTALMSRQLADVHRRGEVAAALWASESGIYERFGYGVAAPTAACRIATRHSAFRAAPAPPGRLRVLAADAALAVRLQPAFDAVRALVPGMVPRTAARWADRLAPTPHPGEAAGDLVVGVHEDPAGTVDGYVCYRVQHEWHGAGAAATLRVEELRAADPAVEAVLWRLCLDLDLVAEVEARKRPLDDPLRDRLREPRRLRVETRDGLWLRLVDLPGALAARRYATVGRLVLRVEDRLCPWNDDVFELEAGPDGARCRPTRRSPVLRVPVAALATAYLGQSRLHTLVRAGWVEELQPGAAAAADRLLGWPRAPWCPDVF